MGRGRGKGKKLAIVSRHGDTDSGGEEQLPVHKRRGRPQKPSKNDTNEEESEKNEEEDGDDFKANIKEENSTVLGNAKRRKRHLQAKENSDTVLEDKDAIIRSKTEETTKTNGFRHNGSRRKSKPHRAAEAGVPVVAVYKGF